MKKLLKAEECAGKTVHEIRVTDCEVVVAFVDDTVLLVNLNYGCDCGEAFLQAEVMTARTPWIDSTMFTYGIITKEELEEGRATAKREAEERSKKQRREEYERLRAEFEPKNE